MTANRTFRQTTAFAAIVWIGSVVALGQQTIPFTGTLRFNTQETPQSTSINFVGSDGNKYLIKLLPTWNTDGKPPEVGLVLRSEGKARTLQNLFEPSGVCCHSHAYLFTAKDFNDRAHLSDKTLNRTFHVKRPAMTITSHVSTFRTMANPPSETDIVPFSFVELAVDISVQGLAPIIPTETSKPR